MNTRIQELIKIADYSGALLMASGATEEEIQMRSKVVLAELVIRESIEVMKANDYHGEWLGEKIKDHFGVK